MGNKLPQMGKKPVDKPNFVIFGWQKLTFLTLALGARSSDYSLIVLPIAPKIALFTLRISLPCTSKMVPRNVIYGRLVLLRSLSLVPGRCRFVP